MHVHTLPEMRKKNEQEDVEEHVQDCDRCSPPGE